MTVARLLSGICAALAIGTSAGAQEVQSNFSGRWRLDPDASSAIGGGRGRAVGGGGGSGGGIGLGPPAQELAIQHNDTLLIVDLGGTGETLIRYRLDGTQTRNLLPVGGRATADATYSSRWNGERLTTTITRTIDTRGTRTELRYRELMYITPEGGLVLETTMSGRPGGRTSVYRKVN